MIADNKKDGMMAGEFTEYAGVEITTVAKDGGGFRAYCDRYQSVYADGVNAGYARDNLHALLMMRLRESLETTLGKKRMVQND